MATTLVAVDGAAPPADGLLVPSGGTLRLTLRTGDAEEVVVPVLHRGGPTAGIDLPEDDFEPDPDFPEDDFRFGPPIDDVVVGGPTVAAAPLLADGGSAAGEPVGGRLTADVVALARADGSQVRVSYDRTDSFTLNGEAVTLEQFERGLLTTTFGSVVDEGTRTPSRRSPPTS